MVDTAVCHVQRGEVDTLYAMCKGVMWSVCVFIIVVVDCMKTASSGIYSSYKHVQNS